MPALTGFGWTRVVKMARDPYDGKKDAEEILWNVMRRRNWTVGVRDDLAAALERIVDIDRNPKRDK